MNQQPSDFKVAAIGRKFKRAYSDLDQLLATLSEGNADALRQILHSGVDEYKQQGSLTIAFVGQYSAGKSTIISALTRRRDIHIDTDIATDRSTAYSWNGLQVIDTPGLFTEREDHDEITYSAIDKADLLVFCLTHMLFDNITISNFKKLAYDKGYGWKMMLVINKMSAEAGETPEKIASYQKSLADALTPHELSDFQVCFIDAKDFCEGVDEEDDFLQEISRFDTFTTALNTFASKRASFSKLDTPIRIVLSVADKVETLLVPSNTEDAMYLEVLRQLSRRVEQERDRLRTKVRNLDLQIADAVLNEGDILAQAVGDESFTNLNAQSEIKVHEHYEKAEQSLEKLLERAIESIRIEIEGELEKDMPQAFITRLQTTHKSGEYSCEETQSAESVRLSVEGLQAIAERVGANFVGQATRGVLKTARKGAALRNMDVAGGNLHRGVKIVGKMLGYKFKPWQAVGIAKNLGNAAKFLGPAAALAGVALEIHSQSEERKRDRRIVDVRRDIRKQFQDISVDIKAQIQNQLLEFEEHVYNDIQSQIEHERQEREFSISTASSNQKALSSIRNDLNAALADVRALAI